MAKKKPVQTGIPLEYFIINDRRNMDIFLSEDLHGSSEAKRLKQAIIDTMRDCTAAHVEAEQETQDRRKRGGETTAQKRTENTKERNMRIVAHAESLLTSGRARRELAGILSNSHKLSTRHIRTILLAAGI